MNQSLRGILVAAFPATLGILFGIGVILYGLNHGNTSEKTSAKAGGTQQTASGQTSKQPTGADAGIQSFVKSTCAACHGADLKGGVGPNLYEAAKKLDEQKIADILKNGTPSGMPGGLAKGKEEAVAKYIKSLAQSQ